MVKTNYTRDYAEDDNNTILDATLALAKVQAATDRISNIVHSTPTPVEPVVRMSIGDRRSTTTSPVISLVVCMCFLFAALAGVCGIFYAEHRIYKTEITTLQLQVLELEIKLDAVTKDVPALQSSVPLP